MLKAHFCPFKLAKGKNVELEYDLYQDDKFGRILAYVWVEEKGKRVMLNQKLLEEGLAKVVIYEDRRKLKYQEELLAAEETARKKEKGIWGF